MNEPEKTDTEAYSTDKLAAYPELLQEYKATTGPRLSSVGMCGRRQDRTGGKISHDYDHWLRIEEVCAAAHKRIIGLNKSLCWYRAHDARATVRRRHEFDAHYWQQEARERRRQPVQPITLPFDKRPQ